MFVVKSGQEEETLYPVEKVTSSMNKYKSALLSQIVFDSLNHSAAAYLVGARSPMLVGTAAQDP